MATVDIVAASEERLALARRARVLAWTSLAWLWFEGAATALAGVLAGSIALVANGLDSGIEAVASLIVVWRFAAARIESQHAETTAQRLIAISFFLLAPYVAIESGVALATEHRPDTTWLGIGLSLSTLAICPWLGQAKIKLGARLHSRATTGEGRQNLICAYLASGVLVGLLANAAFGAWWLDPLVALAISAVAIREGQRAWHGEPHCEGCC